MKLTVLNWIKDVVIQCIGRSIEVLFRFLLVILPLGVYLIVLQNRKKVSKVSNLSVYTNENSVWQHVFPGFILVSIDPTMLKNAINKQKEVIQTWIKNNKYILSVVFMLLVIALMIYRR